MKYGVFEDKNSIKINTNSI